MEDIITTLIPTIWPLSKLFQVRLAWPKRRKTGVAHFSTVMTDSTLFSCISYTVELRWLEHFWNHENMFEIGGVRANECLSKREIREQNRDILSIFFNIKVWCVFLLESPHRGDSNEYTQYTIFNM